jgi:hypothetical protein
VADARLGEDGAAAVAGAGGAGEVAGPTGLSLGFALAALALAIALVTRRAHPYLSATHETIIAPGAERYFPPM